MRLIDGKPWTHSTATDIRGVLKAHGHEAPEAKATQEEAKARIEGAMRAMRVIQAEAQGTTVLPFPTIKFEQR